MNTHDPNPGRARDLLRRLCAPAGDPSPPPWTLLVVAHPDDESVGAASRLTRLDPAAVIYVTDGAPRDGADARAAGCASWADYAALRRDEARRALAHAGIASHRIVFLDHPDQQAAFRLAAVAAQLRQAIALTRPEIVLTHAYEGGHPDHDAVAFAVHAAAAQIARAGGEPPAILEFAGYHARGEAWEFTTFVSVGGHEERVLRLAPAARRFKRRLLACHASQARTLAAVPVGTERFRVAPTYDFTRPPHAEPVLYERYPWGLTMDRWCALARAAIGALELEPATA